MRLRTCRLILALAAAVAILPLAACGDRIDLDKSLIIQVLGLDTGTGRKIKTYYSAPTFTEQAQGSGAGEVFVEEEGNSLRRLRQKTTADSGANLLSGKIRIILISGRFLQTHDLFQELNVLYRDPINPNDAVLVYTETPIKDIFSVKWPLYPNVSTYIQELLNSANRNGLGVLTTLERYNYLHFNRGMTPVFSEIEHIGGHLRVKGVVLLSKEGKRRARLTGQNTLLLLILRNAAKTPTSYSFTADGAEISFDILRSRTKIQTDYRNERFHFTVRVNVNVNLSEYTEDRGYLDDRNEIVAAVTEELQARLGDVIRTCQKAGVDPIGFGMQARAHAYSQFKKVENRWPETFAKAEVQVIPDVRVKRFGIIK